MAISLFVAEFRRRKSCWAAALCPYCQIRDPCCAAKCCDTTPIHGVYVAMERHPGALLETTGSRKRLPMCVSKAVVSKFTSCCLVCRKWARIHPQVLFNLCRAKGLKRRQVDVACSLLTMAARVHEAFVSLNLLCPSAQTPCKLPQRDATWLKGGSNKIAASAPTAGAIWCCHPTEGLETCALVCAHHRAERVSRCQLNAQHA